jgi:hypothetical protein
MVSHTPNDIRHRVDRVVTAARNAGLRADDPMRPVIVALVDMVVLCCDCAKRVDSASARASERITEATRDASQAIDGKTRRLRQDVQKAEREAAGRITRLVLASAGRLWARRQFWPDLASALVGALLLLTVAMVALGAGFAWGQHRAIDGQGRAGPVRIDGVGDALGWRELSAWNDSQSALRACLQSQHEDSSGRRWCDIRLWIEAPHNAHGGTP